MGLTGLKPEPVSSELPTGEQSRGRSRALDVLRGIAILLVLGAHNVHTAPASGPVYWLHQAWSLYGWTGVDLFFVLSGFLVGGLLFREVARSGRVDAKRFLSRRAFKIWPLYFVYIFVEIGLFGHRGGWHFPMELLPNLLHLQNYLGTPLGHTWSLAVEEHFYLLLAFSMAWAASRKCGLSFASIAAVTGAIVLGCNLLRLPFGGDEYAGIAWATRATHLRIDGLAVGVFLAALYHLQPAVWDALARRKGALALVAVVGIGFIAFFPKEGQMDRTIGYTTLYIGYAALLVLAQSAPKNSTRGKILQTWPARLVASVGVCSYGMYLWHVSASTRPIEWFLAKSHLYDRVDVSVAWLITSFVYACLAYALGFVMTVAVERPMLAIRDRLAPSKAAGVPTER
jgi:peptidoglycan/LPS O-acetylase OafA/YrhL